MQNVVFLAATIAAGVLFGFQSPINAALAKRVGVYESAFISFTGGMLTLAVIILFFGKGDLRSVTGAPWWQFIGGFIGVIYITTVVMAVPKLGVTAAMVAILAGQLTVGLLVDQFGWFGLPIRSLDLFRLGGVGLLFVSLWLIYGKH